MQAKKIDMMRYAIRLDKGERLVETVNAFLVKENIKNGFFLGLGSCSSAELALYDMDKKEYHTKVFQGAFEITSLYGNISEKDGKPYIHAHIVIGDEKFNAFTGHLKEAIVYATCEVVLVKFKGSIRRKFNDVVGLNLLEI